MAFIPHKYELADSPATEYIKSGAITTAVGSALYYSSGAAALATGTNKPTHIAMNAGGHSAGDMIPAIRIRDDIIFESVLSVDSASIAVGAKYTIDTTGGKVTATTSDGVCEVVGWDGKAAGDTVYVRF